MEDENKVVEAVEQVGFVNGIIQEVINSPLNIALIAIITFLIFKIFKSRQPPKPSPPSEPELPKLRKDFTVAELKAFDGNQPDGRVLVAVNGTVYDVTRGKRFYGPGKLTCCTFFAWQFLFSKFQLTSCSLNPDSFASFHSLSSLLVQFFFFLPMSRTNFRLRYYTTFHTGFVQTSLIVHNLLFFGYRRVQLAASAVVSVAQLNLRVISIFDSVSALTLNISSFNLFCARHWIWNFSIA